MQTGQSFTNRFGISQKSAQSKPFRLNTHDFEKDLESQMVRPYPLYLTILCCLHYTTNKGVHNNHHFECSGLCYLKNQSNQSIHSSVNALPCRLKTDLGG